MATVVFPLINGFSDAPSGTALFYAIGTNTPATAFDYSSTGVESSLGSSVTLDASGRKRAYVKQRVDVVIKNAAGTEVIRFPFGVGDDMIEVESSLFNGTLPSGSQGSGGKALLATKLDLLYTSWGARDGKVLVTGGSNEQYLKDALVSASAHFYSVKAATYGALGDDSNDDTAEIQAAIDAAVTAGGGVVFFPAGTYKITAALSVSSQKVKFLGVGHRASIIKNYSTSGNAVTISSGGADDCGIVLQDLAVIANSSSTGIAVHASAATGLELRDCRIDGHLVGVKADTRVYVRGGSITTTGSGVAYCVQVASGGTGDGTTIRDCELINASTTANVSAVLVQRADVCVDNCIIDTSASAATSAGVRADHTSGVNSMVRGCKFVAGSGNFGYYITAAVSFNDLGGNRATSGSLFGNTGAGTTTGSQARLTRENSFISVSQGAGTYLVDAQYGRHLLTSTSGNQTIQISSSSTIESHGSRMTIAIKATGAACTPTFGTGFAPASAVGVIDAGKIAIFDFMFIGSNWQAVNRTADEQSPHVF